VLARGLVLALGLTWKLTERGERVGQRAVRRELAEHLLNLVRRERRDAVYEARAQSGHLTRGRRWPTGCMCRRAVTLAGTWHV